ncbi:MAG: glycosyltransferase family 1 protein, partial [bacterium]|nr:glycosyltransferase family 1 protein [bacterium]
VGGLPEVVEDRVSGRLVPSGNPIALAGAIREFLSMPPTSMRNGVTKVASRMTWDGLVQCILDLAQV